VFSDIYLDNLSPSKAAGFCGESRAKWTGCG